MFRMSQAVALILAFVLGFSCCGGVLVGGAAIALSSFRVRDIEKHGLADIPDELFMGSDPEVDLLNLSAFELINELKEVYAQSDKVTINFLQSRYDLKIPAAAEKFLTDEARNIPVKKLFSEEGVKELLSSVYVGYVQGFECHMPDSTDTADPALGKDGARWFNPTTGEYVTGINETLSFISLGDFVSGKVDIQAVIGGLYIGEALGYYPEIDPVTGDEVWCDGVTGEPVTGIMGVFAGCTVYNVGDKINTVEIGELLGYYERDGVWYEKDENGNEKRLTGVMAVFAGCQIDKVGDKINEALLGDLLGYEKIDDDWFQEEENGTKTKVTGVMAVLADSKMNTVGDTLEDSQLGVLLGYEKNGDTWYEQNELTGVYDVPVDGFMSKIAEKNINNMGDAFDDLTVGDMVSEEDRQGGIFAIIAPETPITNIAGAINDSIEDSPLQFFMNEGLITFDDDTRKVLDKFCTVNVKLHKDNSEFKKYYEDKGDWEKEGDFYLIPEWRTQPLGNSFNYIINLLTTPSIPFDE